MARDITERLLNASAGLSWLPETAALLHEAAIEITKGRQEAKHQRSLAAVHESAELLQISLRERSENRKAAALEILDDAPVLNMTNYDSEQVRDQDHAIHAAIQILTGGVNANG